MLIQYICSYPPYWRPFLHLQPENAPCCGERERRDVCKVLVGKPDGKRPLGIPRHRWKDNIKMDLQEIEAGVWTGSIWLRIGTVGGHLYMR
jgi:hypothetical protein